MSRSERWSTLNSSPPFCCPPLLFTLLMLYSSLLQGSHYGRLRTEPICLWDGQKRGDKTDVKEEGSKWGLRWGEKTRGCRIKSRGDNQSLWGEVCSHRTLEHTAFGRRLLLLQQMVWRCLWQIDFSLCICMYAPRPSLHEGICETACSMMYV